MHWTGQRESHHGVWSSSILIRKMKDWTFEWMNACNGWLWVSWDPTAKSGVQSVQQVAQSPRHCSVLHRLLLFSPPLIVMFARLNNASQLIALEIPNPS